jgi:hypothetical protein
MMRQRSDRRGYALLLVIVFVVLFSAILGVAWRRVASAFRIENAGTVRRLADTRGLQGLADAMNLLESRLEWDQANSTFALADAPDGSPFAYTIGRGDKYCDVNITRDPAIAVGTKWNVTIRVRDP